MLVFQYVLPETLKRRGTADKLGPGRASDKLSADEIGLQIRNQTGQNCPKYLADAIASAPKPVETCDKVLKTLATLGSPRVAALFEWLGNDTTQARTFAQGPKAFAETYDLTPAKTAPKTEDVTTSGLKLKPVKTNQKTMLLSLFQSIETYYGPDAGMPRVAKFFGWLKENEAQLAEEAAGQFPFLKSPGYMKTADKTSLAKLGVWLGGKYLVAQKLPDFKPSFFLSIYEYDKPEKLEWIAVGRNMGELCIWVQSKSIEEYFAASSATQTLIEGINAGIHEYSHVLGHIKDSAPGRQSAVSELGACLSNPLLLPLLLASMPKGHREGGVRNGRQALQSIIDSEMGSAPDEYLSQILAPWIQRYLGDNVDITQFRSFQKMGGNDSLREYIFRLTIPEHRYDYGLFLDESGISKYSDTGKNLRAMLLNVFKRTEERAPSCKTFNDRYRVLMEEMDREFGVPDSPDFSTKKYCIAKPTDGQLAAQAGQYG